MTADATLDVAVYGIINAGKSSLINALTRRNHRATGPIGGTTSDVDAVEWVVVGEGEGTGTHAVRLIDTPGLEEVDGGARGDLATDAARSADLVLFVLAEDLTATARRALLDLREVGKPILVVVNKVDLLDDEQDRVLDAIRRGLDGVIPADDILPAAAAPIVRRLLFNPDGTTRVETTRGEPGIDALEGRLLAALDESAADLRALSEISTRVNSHRIARDADRARLRERATQVADETGAALAVALAVNPIPLIDFLAGPGGLAILVRRVMGVYGESPSAEAVKGLAFDLIRGGRVAMWGSLAGTIAGGALKLVPGFGHLAGAIAQGASAGYFAHVVGRALVTYLDNGHDWGDGGLVAALDRIAATTDRRALTRGLVDRIKARVRGRA